MTSSTSSVLRIASIIPAGGGSAYLTFENSDRKIMARETEFLRSTAEGDYVKLCGTSEGLCFAVPPLDDEFFYYQVSKLYDYLWGSLEPHVRGPKASDRKPMPLSELADLLGRVTELQSALAEELACRASNLEAPEPESKPEEDEPQPVLEDLDAAVHTPFKPLLGEWLGTRPADLGDRVVHNLSLREYPTYIYKFGGFGGEGCVRRAAKILGLYWQEDRMKRGEVLAVTVLLETEDGQIGYALFRKEDTERLMRWEVQPGHYLMLTYDGTQPYALDSMSNFKPITVCSMDDPALRPALAPEKRWVVLDSCADEGPDSSVAGFAKIGTEMWVEVPEDSRFVIGADPERAYLRVHKVYGPAFSIRALPVSAAAR